MDQTRSPYTGPPARTLVVQSSGTIQAAINSITDASASKRYAVLVYPGTYTEQITMKAYVDLVGMDRDSCVIDYSATGTAVIPASNSTLANLSLKSLAGADSSDNKYGTVVATAALTDFTMEDCYLEGGNWSFRLKASGCARILIRRNILSSPNPIYFNMPDQVLVNWPADVTIADNVWGFNGNAYLCHGFFDGVGTRLRIVGNKGISINANVGTGTSYAMAVGGSQCLIADNHFAVYDSVRAIGRVLQIYCGASGATDDNTLQIYGNDLIVHLTKDGGVSTADVVYCEPQAGATYLPPVDLGRNNLRLILSSGSPTPYGLRVNTAFATPANTPNFYYDRRCFGGYKAAFLSWVPVRLTDNAATKRTVVEYYKDVAAKSATAIYSAKDIAGLDVENDGPETPTNQPDVPRCLQYVFSGTCTGYLYVDILTPRGEILRETVPVAVGTVTGVIPASHIELVSVSTGATGTMNMGTLDKLGLSHPIAATADVIHVSKNFAAPAAASAVDAINQTVTPVGTITAGDDFEVWVSTIDQG